jgi:hypothetical protein
VPGVANSGVRVEAVPDRDMIFVAHEAMRALAEAAFADINKAREPRYSLLWLRWPFAQAFSLSQVNAKRGRA